MHLWAPIQDMYSDDRRVWNKIFLMIAEHFASLETNGVDLGRNGWVYPIVLGVKGDWNFLVICICSYSIVVSCLFLSGCICINLTGGLSNPPKDCSPRCRWETLPDLLGELQKGQEMKTMG